MSAPLIVTPEVYEWMRAMGTDPLPNVLVTISVPMHWPADKPWPPQVTLPAEPCWGCITGPRTLASPLAAFLPLAG